RGVDHETVADDNPEFVRTAVLRDAFVDEAAIDLHRLLGTAVVPLLALHAGPARKRHEAADATGVRDVQVYAFALAISISSLGLRHHDPGHSRLLDIAGGLRQTGKG